MACTLHVEMAIIRHENQGVIKLNVKYGITVNFLGK